MVVNHGVIDLKFCNGIGGVMDASQVIELGRESLWVAVMVASPLLGVALAAGLIIGIFQAATSILSLKHI